MGGNPSINLSFADVQYAEKLYSYLSDKYSAEEARSVLDFVLDKITAHQSSPSLTDLHTVIKHCRRCATVKPEPELPTWNYVSPDLVLVNDTMFLSGNSSEILTNSLKESGWTSNNCAFTALVRCPLNTSRAPYVTEISTCSSYLDFEIQIWKPKLIVPLGLRATEFFLGDKIKISDTKSKIYWIGPWAVMPTISPIYIAMNDSKPSLAEDFIRDLTIAREFCYGP